MLDMQRFKKLCMMAPGLRLHYGSCGWEATCTSRLTGDEDVLVQGYGEDEFMTDLHAVLVKDDGKYVDSYS